MAKSDRARWVVLTSLACLWIIWNQWAAFFFWLTQWVTISDGAVLSDFFNLYQSGKWWLEGWGVAGLYIDPSNRALTYPLAYPPSSLPFLGFFALFPFGVAAQLWTTLCLAVFVGASLSVLLIVNSKRKYLFASVAMLLIFTSYPLQVELHLGQINLLVSSITLLGLVCQRLQHRFASAALLAIGTMMKGPPILFLIYFVVFRRDLRYLVDFSASTLAIVGLSLFAFPIQLYSYWIVHIVPTLFVGSGGENESILGLYSLAGLSSLTPVILITGVCLFAAFAFYVNSHRFKGFERSSLSADAMFLMNTLVILVLGSRSWPQDYVWVVLPTALFLSGLIMEDVKIGYFALIGVATLLFNLNTYPVFPYYLNFRLPMIPIALIGNFLMLSGLVLYYLRHNTILNGRH